MAVLNSIRTKIDGGYLQRGTAQFSTTDATFELPVDFERVESIAVCPLDAYAAADQLSVNETVTSEGVIIRPAAGTLTVTRTTGGTSGLKFSFQITGK